MITSVIAVPLTTERLREIVHYDPVTGQFTWVKNSHRRRAGASAGGFRPDGYRIIILDRKWYFGHRLAWLYMTGSWPADGIDHVNMCKGDNRWENLRAATQSQNGANNLIRIDNTSGVKGVSWHRGIRRWHARIVVRGKTHSLGTYADISDARDAYAAAAKKFFGEFARVAA